MPQSSIYFLSKNNDLTKYLSLTNKTKQAIVKGKLRDKPSGKRNRCKTKILNIIAPVRINVKRLKILNNKKIAIKTSNNLII